MTSYAVSRGHPAPLVGKRCLAGGLRESISKPRLSTVYTAARQFRSSSDNSVLRRPSVRTVYGLSHTPPLLLGTLFLSSPLF